MNKAPVLSKEKIGDMWEQWTTVNCPSFEEAKVYATERLSHIAQAQNDADHKHYQGIIREIFGEIESWKYVSPANLYQCTMNEIIEKLGQSLKTKYQEEKPDSIKDYEEQRRKGTGLPKDWSSRVLKEEK